MPKHHLPQFPASQSKKHVSFEVRALFTLYTPAAYAEIPVYLGVQHSRYERGDPVLDGGPPSS